MILEYIKDFLLMLQLMTRIPIKKSFPCEMKNFRDGASFFALIGLVVGLFQYGIYRLLILFLPLNAAAVFALLSAVLITGGFHIDGLGDTCDGFFAFKGKDKVIEIMKDSRIGTFACIAIVFDLLIKYILTSEMLKIDAAAAFIIPPVVGRASISLLSFIGQKAKETGSGNLFIRNVGIVQIILNLAVVLTVSIWISGARSLVLPIGAGIITIFFNRLCISKMNGITGDSFGANNEIVEILTLVILCAVI